MRKLPLIALTVTLCLGVQSTYAAECASGPYRAGCTGPNGAAVVKKPYRAPYHPPTAACASGPNRAGCAGPNGAAVVRRPY